MSKKTMKKEKLFNHPNIHKSSSTRWSEGLFDNLCEAVYENKTYFKSPDNGHYQCPEFFCNIFIRIASFYKTDDYNTIRNIIKKKFHIFPGCGISFFQD
ncbi:MAG: hypothetical protein HFI70_13800 [Lachnospiraceae bacterium]|nr:hypothetical protein [Lachnospiraceae bacterium]